MTDEFIKNIYIYIYVNYMYIYVYVYITLIIKKNEIFPFVTTWMYLKYIMLSEISQTEKEKYYTFSLTCGI